MSEKKNNVMDFIKRNAYYIVIAFAILVIATVIAIILAANANRSRQVNVEPNESAVVVGDKDEEKKDSEKKEDETLNPQTPDNNDKENEKEPQKEEKPTAIVFTTPVNGGTVSKEYTSSTVVYNKTLGVYTGHMGLDFSADAGTEVMCCYAGTVEEITTSYLGGTTVTVDHGNGLKTVYNSIEVADGLVKGASVAAGQVIGYVSDNNRREYKDGPHLHLEVEKDGLKVDPESYLATGDK